MSGCCERGEIYAGPLSRLCHGQACVRERGCQHSKQHFFVLLTSVTCGCECREGTVVTGA